MTKYYDENGNPVENVLTKEEADKIAEEKVKGFQDELSQTKEQLSKFESKDFNFKKLRDMNKDEREALTAKELELLKRQETLEEAQTKFVDEQKKVREKELESYREEALAKYASSDEELKKKVLFHFNRLADVSITKSDIEKKMGDAWILATGGGIKVNPLAHAMGVSGIVQPVGKEKSGSKLTDDQLDLLRKMYPNLSEEELRKQGKI